ACSSGYYVASGKGSKSSPYVYQQLLYPGTSIPYNYNAIYNAIQFGYAVLPDSEPVANESAKSLNPASGNPVPWPITYKLTISPAGLLNFAYSYNNGAFQPVLTDFNIATANGPIPASLRFGFSAGTGGDNNVHEITCFTASPLQSNSSVAGNTVTGKVQGAVQFFFASYSQNNWWGSLVADPLVIDASGNLDIGTAATWDAKCVLTGNGQGGTAPCDTMTEADGTDPTGIYEPPSQRTLLTSNGLGAGDGVTLAWNNLGTAEQNALNVPNTNNPQDATPGQNRVAWLQGYRNVEQLYGGNSSATPPVSACSSTPVASPPCDLRARTYVLGDIINSSPTFVGAPGPSSQPDVFTDKFDGAADPDPEDATGAQSYSAFAAANLERLNLVYVGSNDGFVHGFEAGANNSDGSFNSTDNDGKEVVAYMPYDVLMDKAVNLSNPLYQHDYLVDATPGVGDVFYGSDWHTWLVGGVGSTGDEIYALDITDPTSFSASDVIGDWDNTSAALDDASGVNHLGATVGTPTIARMHNGDWAFIFGSGLQPAPATGAPAQPTEGVYIGLIDPTTGSVSFQFLDTGAEPTGAQSCTVPQPPPPAGTPAPPPVVCPGGIAYVSWVDLDGDGIADYLYAGDTQGRVWRFDVSSSSPANWAVSKFGNAGPTPLFVAEDASGNAQPITTSILSLQVTTGLVTREMLFFGTGQEIQQSSTASTTYAKDTQTFYGIWDWNMAKWNAKSTTTFASLSGPQSFTRANLLEQKATQASPTAPRILSTTATVCWDGAPPSESCATQNQYGWL
ncbi:MAG: pilus assembly protein, partial [Rhodanobacteraceae bacterium]